ncbi:hypothetical protein BGX31_000079 [Mortierella sp. GBA43]|nr:hypothetical protein BGX31_000079 [Mortierella sp. GBA43]
MLLIGFIQEDRSLAWTSTRWKWPHTFQHAVFHWDLRNRTQVWPVKAEYDAWYRFNVMIKKYHEDKIDGTSKQYWDRRRLEQAAKESKEEVELQTSVTVNRTTTRAMQPAEKQANDHLEKFDESISSGN